jgi:hypothetical protein
MNFIVNQQAQFAADMQRLENSQAQFATDMQRLEVSQARTDQVVAAMGGAVTQAVSQVGEVVTRLANVTHAGFTDTNAKIDALFDAQIRSEEKSVRTDENIARTEESIKRLSDTVDRYIRERNNGQ